MFDAPEPADPVPAIQTSAKLRWHHVRLALPEPLRLTTDRAPFSVRQRITGSTQRPPSNQAPLRHPTMFHVKHFAPDIPHSPPETNPAPTHEACTIRRPGLGTPASKTITARPSTTLTGRCRLTRSRESARPACATEPQRASSNSRLTLAAIARLAVSPGDSMPNRFTSPAKACRPAPSSRKSAAGSPGPTSLGRMPA